MIRPLAISLILASPAGASTLTAIHIEECRQMHIASGPVLRDGVPTEWRTVVEETQTCRHPPAPINPFPLTMAALHKGWPEFPAPPTTLGAFRPAADAYSLAAAGDAGDRRRIGGFLPAGPSPTSTIWTFTTPCDCEELPPAPVPLPGAAWLMLAGMIGLWRMKR